MVKKIVIVISSILKFVNVYQQFRLSYSRWLQVADS